MPPAHSLDAVAVRALRLAAQGLRGALPARPEGPGDARVASVVGRMLALQGQDATGVRWSVGLRAPGVTDADVSGALARGVVVRTWPMRGTLHLLRPADVRWLLGLTADRMLRSMAPRRANLGITADDCNAAVAAAYRLLADAAVVGRTAFLDGLAASGVRIEGQRGYHLLSWLAISGHVVLGAGPDGQPAVLLADAWLPPTSPRDRDEALAELAVRYVGSHGPASELDLARWSGLPVTEVRRGIAAAGPLLEAVSVVGTVQHVAMGTLDALTATSGSAERPAGGVHLLPGFDEYLLGYADRSVALAPGDAARVIPGGNGMFRPTLVADGRIAGTWTRTTRGGRIEITVERFPDAPAPDPDELTAAVAAYRDFVRAPVSLSGSARSLIE